MTAIRWTSTARDDLRAIHAYIARDSDVYARRFIQRIKTAVAGLKTLPEAGAWVAEWERDDLREIFVGNYRVIYHVTGKRILVLTVIHSARQLPDVNRIVGKDPP